VDGFDMAGSSANPVAVVGRLVEQPQVVADADERPPVAAKHPHQQGLENSIHGTALEAELARLTQRSDASSASSPQTSQ
jgi:hypothetical protein